MKNLFKTLFYILPLISACFAQEISKPIDTVIIGTDIFYPLDLPNIKTHRPTVPQRIDVNTKSLQALLKSDILLNPQNIYIAEWDSSNKHPMTGEVEYRVTFDLYTSKAVIGFKRNIQKNYAICFSNNKPKYKDDSIIPLIGAGEPVSVGRANLNADLGQGLAGAPSVVDFDGDGDQDLLVSFEIPKRMFLFENIGTAQNGEPVLKAPEMILEGKSFSPFDIFQDSSGEIWGYSIKKDNNENKLQLGKFQFNQNKNAVSILSINEISIAGLPEKCNVFDIILQDADGDGVKDLLLGVLEGTWWWPDGINPWNKGKGNPKIGYGKGYDSNNLWLGKPPVGSIYLALNKGTNTSPKFESAQILTVSSNPIKIPTTQMSPCLIDLNKDGRLDLLLAVGVDKILAFYNTSQKPNNIELSPPVNALANTPVSKWSYFDSRFELCDWDKDGNTDIIMCSNPGVVVKCGIKNSKVIEEKILQCRGGNIWAETLVVPTVIDFDSDSKWDIITGDSSGYLSFFKNTGTEISPLFTSREKLKAGDSIFHIMAGYSGSIQGPEEARWGYLQPEICDWDGDGKLDAVCSDITGHVYWLWNKADKSGDCILSEPILLEINTWPLKVRWRTKPCAWPGKSLPNLITIDNEGFLALYERDISQGISNLQPAKRIRDESGNEIKIDGPGGYNGRGALCSADWNKDGKMDILIGQPRRSGIHESCRFDLPKNKEATILIMLNIGSNEEPVLKKAEQLRLADGSNLYFGTHTCAPTVYDYDKDGLDDVFIGSEDGFIYCYNRTLFEDAAQIIKIPATLEKAHRKD